MNKVKSIFPVSRFCRPFIFETGKAETRMDTGIPGFPGFPGKKMRGAGAGRGAVGIIFARGFHISEIGRTLRGSFLGFSIAGNSHRMNALGRGVSA